MTNHLVVEGVTSLYAVDYLTLLVIAHSWYHSDCLVEIYIEILVGSLNLLHAETFKCLDELVENHLYTFLDSLRIFALVGECALKVVEDRKDGRDGLLATIENQFSLLLHGALAVVLKLGSLVKQSLLELFYFLLSLLQRVNFCLVCLIVSILCLIVSICRLCVSLFRILLISLILYVIVILGSVLFCILIENLLLCVTVLYIYFLFF